MSGPRESRPNLRFIPGLIKQAGVAERIVHHLHIPVAPGAVHAPALAGWRQCPAARDSRPAPGLRRICGRSRSQACRSAASPGRARSLSTARSDCAFGRPTAGERAEVVGTREVRRLRNSHGDAARGQLSTPITRSSPGSESSCSPRRESSRKSSRCAPRPGLRPAPARPRSRLESSSSSSSSALRPAPPPAI